MLNRRLIRIKAMQAYYGYIQAMDVNYNLGRENINERFQPDLNSMEVQDKPKLDALKNAALKILALSFLIVIGITIFMEGMGKEVEKSMIYVPMGFAMAIELLQMRHSHNQKKVKNGDS